MRETWLLEVELCLPTPHILKRCENVRSVIFPIAVHRRDEKKRGRLSLSKYRCRTALRAVK